MINNNELNQKGFYIIIPVDLHRALKIESANKNISMADVCTIAFKNYFEQTKMNKK